MNDCNKINEAPYVTLSVELKELRLRTCDALASLNNIHHRLVGVYMEPAEAPLPEPAEDFIVSSIGQLECDLGNIRALANRISDFI